MSNNGLSTHPDFKAGVGQMQNRWLGEMKDAETEACKVLESAEGRRGETDDEDSSDGARAKRLKRRMKPESVGTRKCVDCNFVVGSCAEKERLWSEDDVILTKRRKKMTTIMLEAILFLKNTKSYWDIDEIARADALRLKTNRDSPSVVLAKEVEEYVER